MNKKILKAEEYYEPSNAAKQQFKDALQSIIDTTVQEHDPFAAFRQLIAMDLASEEQHQDSSKPYRSSKSRR